MAEGKCRQGQLTAWYLAAETTSAPWAAGLLDKANYSEGITLSSFTSGDLHFMETELHEALSIHYLL